MVSCDYEIELIDSEIDYWEFHERFLVANRPCILSEQFTRSWKSRNEWVTDDNLPNFQFLKSNFGNARVPVADCAVKYYNSQLKKELKFSNYLSKWKDVISNNSCMNLYLKDWHFLRDFPNYKAYETPKYFSSDWLNEFWISRKDLQDDYRFVYMGPKGTWTPFHSDVFNSYSWSANICGLKKWFLFPPGEEKFLRDTLGQLAYDVTLEELNDPKKYPNYGKHVEKFEFVQQPGQIVFVPSLWHHQVHNLEDTISINHNWLNGCNVNMTWDLLEKTLTDVENEILDCASAMTREEWVAHCQVMLKSLTGIDFEEFCAMLTAVADTRISFLQSTRRLDSGEAENKKRQYLQDLVSIDSTISRVLSCSNSIKNAPRHFLARMNSLSNKISSSYHA